MGNSFTTTPAEATSARKLEAVNEMLEALGEPPVTVLDTGGTSEEAEAEAILDRESRRIQGNGPGPSEHIDIGGWAANTVFERTFTLTGGEIPIGSTILRVRPVGGSSHLNVTIRNGKLYDLERDTATFGGDVTLAVVEELTFEHMPPKLAEYIVKAAALKFQRYKKRGQIDDAIASQEMAMAKVAAEQESRDQVGVNVLNTAEARRVRGSRTTYRGIA